MPATATASNGTAEQSTEQLLATRLAAARKLTSATIRKAAKLEADPAVNRSTRRGAALKLKAEALEEIHKLLSAKT